MTCDLPLRYRHFAGKSSLRCDRGQIRVGADRQCAVKCPAERLSLCLVRPHHQGVLLAFDRVGKSRSFVDRREFRGQEDGTFTKAVDSFQGGGRVVSGPSAFGLSVGAPLVLGARDGFGLWSRYPCGGKAPLPSLLDEQLLIAEDSFRETPPCAAFPLLQESPTSASKAAPGRQRRTFARGMTHRR
jgi:hypothetical protein